MGFEELVVTPWRRYGHDRLYVATQSGQKLGHYDRKSGHVVVEDEAFRAVVERAVGLVPEVPVQPDPYAITSDRLTTDLAQNAPGGGAAQRAREERAAAPVKTLVARAFGIHTNERAWRVGAEGERIVGEELERLRARGWTVIHDVPVGSRGANIDHVVIGPGGVFTVNSKYHWGGRVFAAGRTVQVNGREVDYVPYASREAARAARLLQRAHGAPVTVIGVVAIVCQNQVVKVQPKRGDVLVLSPRQAHDYLFGLQEQLEPRLVERLVGLARRSTTWQD